MTCNTVLQNFHSKLNKGSSSSGATCVYENYWAHLNIGVTKGTFSWGEGDVGMEGGVEWSGGGGIIGPKN